MAAFDWLDDIWQGIGNIGADTDKFMKREMPFDSGWGAPAALVATYFGGPAVLEAMGGAGEGAGALGGAEGISGEGFGNLMTTDPTSFGEGWSASGFDNGGYSPQDQLGLDNLINQQSAKYPMDGASSKPSFQQLLGKQLMQGGLGNMGGQRGSFQHQDAPVQRQAAFAATPAPFQVQNKDTDIAALIAALRKKDFE